LQVQESGDSVRVARATLPYLDKPPRMEDKRQPMALPPLARHTVGVMGSGTDEHDDLARGVGSLLARLGVNLLTGGGRGVMRAVARAFTQAPRVRGVSIGIIPCRSERERGVAKEGYPNEFVELAIHTHLPHSAAFGMDDLSRNHINVLTSAAIVALPGGAGTASEVELALRYGKPVVVHATDASLLRDVPAAVPRVTTLDAVERFVREHLDELG
jgi:uncharacterized protein (TIGR00725 family)